MLSERLKELRSKAGITQKGFAEIFQISGGTIAMWETGKRTPDVEMLKRIADYFGVTVDYLLGHSVATEENGAAVEDENLVLLNRNAKKLSPEKRKQLLDMARLMFKEEFDD